MCSTDFAQSTAHSCSRYLLSRSHLGTQTDIARTARTRKSPKVCSRRFRRVSLLDRAQRPTNTPREPKNTSHTCCAWKRQQGRSPRTPPPPRHGGYCQFTVPDEEIRAEILAGAPSDYWRDICWSSQAGETRAPVDHTFQVTPVYRIVKPETMCSRKLEARFLCFGHLPNEQMRDG
ncbi:hypothetical protein LZ32DRAFT_48364 [Colletotrichum eremochloae]|nr:hypothetical protein LZ32DRAFT_48364 [Colletotrichum eremochloae]